MSGKIQRNMDDLKGFNSTILEKGMVPSVKIISKYLREAGNYYAELFKINSEDRLFFIKRLCLVDGEPVSLEEIYIPEYLMPKLSGIDLNVFSVYETYKMFGINLRVAEETLDLAVPESRDAELLKVEKGTPLMFFQSTSYDDKGRVIEFDKNYVRGDRCDFSVRFFKD
jgi:GntR family transcriptional regulator